VNATSAKGKYGADIVIKPNKDMGVEGCLRDQRYMGTKANGEERKGRLNSGERAFIRELILQAGCVMRGVHTRSRMDDWRSIQK
jgi:hypothetical protein